MVVKLPVDTSLELDLLDPQPPGTAFRIELIMTGWGG